MLVPSEIYQSQKLIVDLITDQAQSQIMASSTKPDFPLEMVKALLDEYVLCVLCVLCVSALLL